MSYFLVTGPDAVREVLHRTDDFLPSNALTSVVPLHPATLRILAGSGFALPPVLASATGKTHRETRSVVARFFRPQRVAGLTERIAGLTADHCVRVERALRNGPVDLARTISAPIPPAIMSELIGIDCPDIEKLKRWSRHSLELFWGTPPPERQRELAHSAAEFYRWLRNQVLKSRPDSLFAALREAGKSVIEVCSLGYFLMIAGQETTSQLINIALYRGLAEPEMWRSLADPSAATEHVRRVLLRESSVPSWRRITAVDTELRGTALPAGTEILLQLTGHYPEDARPTAYSLAFGYGLHRCLGAKLAEIEAVTVLRETAARLPNLHRVGPNPEWLRLLSFRTPLTVIAARG